MYVGALVPDPFAPLKLARCPHSLVASLATLPSMSLIPFAPLLKGWMFKPFRGYNNAN